jgi:hypothetical protein
MMIINHNNAQMRQGSIVVISLMMLLVMTAMGIGLYNVTLQQSQQVGISLERVDSLHAAESCIDESIQWLIDEAKTDIPCKDKASGTRCKIIGDKSMRHSLWESKEDRGVHKDKKKKKLERNFYRCDIFRASTLVEALEDDAKEKPEGEEGYDVSDDDYEIKTSYYSYYKIKSYSCVSDIKSCLSSDETAASKRSVEVIVKFF